MNRIFSKSYILILIFISLLPTDLSAQIIETGKFRGFTDSLRNDLINAPYFTLFKDNYFTVGTSIRNKPTAENSDVKFQISFAQRVTKTTLPGNSFIFIMYTQKTLWNVFQESMPMRDLNFNPGIGWTFPFFSKGRYAGKLTILLEHESNGRDGDASRSWNKISFSGSTIIDRWLSINAKAWIPIIDGMNNKDILHYSGICQCGFVVNTPDRNLIWSLLLTKRLGNIFNYNITAEFSWRIWKRSNQYFFLQYYNGYGENLLDYNKFRSRLRVGFVIKPKFFSEF